MVVSGKKGIDPKPCPFQFNRLMMEAHGSAAFEGQIWGWFVYQSSWHLQVLIYEDLACKKQNMIMKSFLVMSLTFDLFFRGLFMHIWLEIKHHAQ